MTSLVRSHELTTASALAPHFHAPRHAEGTPWDAERLSALIGDIYDAALDPSRWVGVLHKAREFVGGSAAALFSKDACRREPQRLLRRRRCRPALQAALLRHVRQARPRHDGPRLRRDRAAGQHGRSHRLRRVRGDALLQGVGAAAATGGFHQRRAREVGDQRRHVRRVPARARRPRRRGDAEAHAAHRSAYPPRSADRPGDRSQDRGSCNLRGHPRWTERRHVPRRARRGASCMPTSAAMPCWTTAPCCARRAASSSPPTTPQPARSTRSSPWPAAATRRSAPRASPCRSPRATASAMSPTCCRSPPARGAARARLFGRCRAFRAQGGARHPVPAGGHRQDLQAHADRAARAARHRRRSAACRRRPTRSASARRR